ncbi:CHASE2 domain-containing protein [Alcaligenaceae bacterium]|nr:CHASE2 domain-containing protein [Alcaligenaceae bacterium]
MPTPAPPYAQFWGSLERRMHIEWLLVTATLLALTIGFSYLASTTSLARLDHTFYDHVLSVTMQEAAHPDIAIIAIDDSSIEKIGYWPWRRQIHAQLLDKLNLAKVVGMDLVFNEVNPAYPQDDASLALAMHQNGRVVLPLLIANHDRSVQPPLPIFVEAAAATGYINIYPDTDGIIRSLQLQQTLPDQQSVPHLTLAMLNVAKQPINPNYLKPETAENLLIPYAGSPGHFTVYPYSGVLSGEIPPEKFQDKYVLVGSWGSGLGDTFPTAVSNAGIPMSGVEILANSLQASLHNRWIRPLPAWQLALLACIPVLLACFALRRLSPRQSLLCILLILPLTLASSALLMLYALLWIPVAASVAGVVLAYPVWAWRSQEGALQHIDRELKTLDQQGRLLTGYDPYSHPPRRDNSLPARVTQLHVALNQLRLAQKRRNETLRFLSHDMRAPQNSILALTELQQQPGSALPEAELLKHVNAYAKRTLDLVDGFVQLARAEGSTIASHPLDLVELIEQCCDEFWAQAKQRHIGIKFTDRPDEAWITGDASLLTRVWINLIDNALKYSPDHTDISCHLYEENGMWVALVQDQGRGIKTQQRDSLFAAFTRLDEDTPNNPSGVGLGLAFVKTVIERHRGTISVQARPDRGSSFIIQLPAQS